MWPISCSSSGWGKKQRRLHRAVVSHALPPRTCARSAVVTAGHGAARNGAAFPRRERPQASMITE